MGVHKSANRIKLEAEDIEYLLSRNSYLEIAIRFKVEKQTVYKVAKEYFLNKEIQRFEKTKKEVEFSGTKGAWKELKETPLYKQIMYGRN